MVILVLSIILLVLTPLFYLGALRFKKVWHAIEKVLMIVVATLVTFHLLPESITIGGDYTVVAAFLGLFLPSFLEQLWLRYASKIHFLTVIIGLAGLFIHGMLDGAAMASPRFSMTSTWSTQWLGIAVLLHRIPAGMLLCGMFYKTKGWHFVIFLLSILAIATVAGYMSGNFLLREAVSIKIFTYFQALVAGSLLHVALDQHEEDASGTHQHNHNL